MKRFELISFATADELARTSPARGWMKLRTARRAGKPHCVALSGGRITHKLFASVVEQAKVRKIGDGGAPSFPSNVHFFWADERCVPPDDPESNFKLARELLFAPLRIPENQIHRIRGEDSPITAVKSAEAELRRVILGPRFSPSPQRGKGVEPQPVLDLVFLGMGEDGHVASLFPDAPAEVVNHPGPFLFVENSPKPPPRRVSLSYAAISGGEAGLGADFGRRQGEGVTRITRFFRKNALGQSH